MMRKNTVIERNRQYTEKLDGRGFYGCRFQVAGFTNLSLCTFPECLSDLLRGHSLSQNGGGCEAPAYLNGPMNIFFKVRRGILLFKGKGIRCFPVFPDMLQPFTGIGYRGEDAVFHIPEGHM